MTSLVTPACAALIIFVAGTCASAQVPAPADENPAAPINPLPSMPEARDELLRMMKVDQWYRARMSRQTQDDLPLPEVLHEDMRAADGRHAERVLKMVRQHGWPGKSKVGRDGALAAFLIVQHASADVQEEMLGVVEAAVEAGEAEPMHLAYLTDRVRMRQGKKQIYGTQLIALAGGRPEPVEIEDPENVDERRAKIGLGPLADYLRGLGASASEKPAAPAAAAPGDLKHIDTKDLPPGVTIKTRDGKPLPPGSKIKIVPVGGDKPVVLGPGGAPISVAAEPDQVRLPELRDALLKEPRIAIAPPEHRPAGAPPGESVMIAGRDDRLERVRAIVEEQGWPGYDMVGRAASAAAFHVVRRAAPEVIKELLPALAAAAESGQANKAHAAYLDDLLRVREGRPQRYGTQVRRSETGEIELAPVEDPQGLDERRAVIGLPPASEFLASLRPPVE